MGITAVHCADLHLDKVFNLSHSKRSVERRKDLQNRFKEVVDYAINENADLFLLAGDVYDKVNPTNNARSFFVEQMKLLADEDIHVFLIAGNHDVPKMRSSTDTALDILESAGIGKFFSSTNELEEETITIDGTTVSILGKSYDTVDESGNPLDDVSVSSVSDVNILLIHGSFQEDSVPKPPESDSHQPIYTSDINPFDYVALGHYHQHFVYTTSDDTMVGMPGTLERLSFNEADQEKGFLHLDITEDAINTEFVPIDARELETKTLKLSPDTENVEQAVLDFVEDFVDDEKIFRLKLTGTITMDQQRDLDIRAIFDAANELFYSFQLERDDLEIEGFGRMYAGEVETAEEAFKTRMKALIKEEDDEEEAFLEDVKEQGLRYLEACQ